MHHSRSARTRDSYEIPHLAAGVCYICGAQAGLNNSCFFFDWGAAADFFDSLGLCDEPLYLERRLRRNKQRSGREWLNDSFLQCCLGDGWMVG